MTLSRRRRGSARLALPLAVLLAACGTSGGSPSVSPIASEGAPGFTASASASGSGSGQSPSDSTSPSATESGPASPSADEFVNPVIDEYFADPFVLEVDGTYYAYGTVEFEATDVATARSDDLVEWEELPTALPDLPAWSTGRTWAAEVAPTSAGYVMYYSTNAPALPNPNGDPSQCISAVAANDPAGPFVDDSEAPFICQPELGGSIDATHFVDTDGTPYLIWKNDGNCCGKPSQLWIQEVSDDGLELAGEPQDVGLRNDRPWEGAVIEGPTLLERDGTYYLFYSGGHFSSAGYAVGYATADSVTGPYEDSPDNPILVTKPPAAGPGHQSIVADKDGDLWFAYHAWDIDQIGEETGGQRTMWLDELVWEDGKPVIQGPDAGPQPRP